MLLADTKPNPHVPIRTFGDPVLRIKTPILTDFNYMELLALQQDMFNIMYISNGIGLAAPQISINKRMFVFDIGKGPYTVINPSIHKTYDNDPHKNVDVTEDEGCLSIPGFFWPVVRTKYIHITGLNIKGQPIEFKAKDLFARVLQHEIDHLNGKLLITHLDKDIRIKALRELRNQTLGFPPNFIVPDIKSTQTHMVRKPKVIFN